MRLFVALNLPPAERQRLYEAAGPLRNGGFPVRWVGPAQLHVTLKFLGEVAESRAEEVVQVVEESARTAEPFELELGGVGGFPSLRRPRVVWLGVAPRPELDVLYEALEPRFERLGFERENRPFHPHVTLGRWAERTGGAGRSGSRDIESVAGSVAYRAVVPVETLDLMRSHLRPTGAQYEVMYAARLGSSP